GCRLRTYPTRAGEQEGRRGAPPPERPRTAAPLADAVTNGLINTFISVLLAWLFWVWLPPSCSPARARPSAHGLRSNPLRSDRPFRPDAKPSPPPSRRRPVRSGGSARAAALFRAWPWRGKYALSLRRDGLDGLCARARG